MLSQTLQWAFLFIKSIWRRYKALPTLVKLFVWAIATFDLAVLVVLAIIGPATVTQAFYDLGQDLVSYRFGWVILGAIMTGPAALIGSAITFIALRFAFRERLRAWTSKNEKWQALEAIVVRSKNLYKIWVFKLFSSTESERSSANYPYSAIAISPVGLFKRLFCTAKVLNIISVVVSVVLGVVAGTVTYRLLQKQVKELHESADRDDELAADALEEAEEGAPLLLNVSSDTVDVESSELRNSL
ncbi:hypothetical protein EW145_g1575 [Phellinidium pouzarii]|uniref:Uncharacterized protein n=1 Tax=Phellinidium pouzarii TaxID=167371 RepID=A0A4V3XDJ8_9AGAM|nr:hypothetical protein EW145_g1575 [Phellinidium pouzarii]